jgi:hypothetical protein
MEVLNLKNIKFIKLRDGRVKELDESKSFYNEGEYKVYFHADGSIFPDKEHSLDIVEVLTRESHPHLYI